MNTTRLLSFGLVAALTACSSSDDKPTPQAALCAVRPAGAGGDAGPRDPNGLYSIGTVIQGPSARTLYIQSVTSLDQYVSTGPATEISGNSRHMAYGGFTYVGYAEKPEIGKFEPNSEGKLVKSSQPNVNFGRYGLKSIPFGNAFISATKAYLFAEAQYKVIVWNPTTMEITGEIDLSQVKKEGFDAELWVATVKGDKVYVPLRYVDYKNTNLYKIGRDANMLVLDASQNSVVRVMHDERCAAAGQPAILDDGTIYVLADGRSYLAQVEAMLTQQPVPKTCILRVKPGETSFDPNYMVEIPSLTGGRNAASQFFHVGNGVGYAKVHYPDQMARGADLKGSAIWKQKAFKYWRFELGDTVKAAEVPEIGFSMIAFGGAVLDGKYYAAESADGATSSFCEFDPKTNTASLRFQMDGFLRDLYRLR
ncbi:hypothetical protein [Pendulispora albinea]|uniref:Uncharacterized protein n=1 Tax=Pendulispora albinea TaxID=2741071 RepID=A0ABZ2M5I8_9BACT